MKKGIDVSSWQTGIDWKKIAKSIDFVIIRSGYGKNISQKDNMFDSHIKGAIAAGIKNIGIYHFSYATNEKNARIEAQVCMDIIKPYKDKINMPIAFDWEYDSRNYCVNNGVTPTRSLCDKMALAFGEEVQKNGYKFMLYTNPDYASKYFTLSKYTNLWIAQYSSSCSVKNADLWQYTSTGKLSGYNGNLDMNILYNDDLLGKTTGTTTKPSSTTKKPAKPTITYKVKTGGKWSKEYKNGQEAGTKGKAITDVAIKVSKGTVKYRVHVKGGSWLGDITGYDVKDYLKGYAGNGKEIDAIEVYYTTPADVKKEQGKYLKAKYRVCPVNGKPFGYQYDTEKTNGQDGYAGLFGKSIESLTITLD